MARAELYIFLVKMLQSFRYLKVNTRILVSAFTNLLLLVASTAKSLLLRFDLVVGTSPSGDPMEGFFGLNYVPYPYTVRVTKLVSESEGF